MNESNEYTSDSTVTIFIAYARKDQDACLRLQTHLAILLKEKSIETWYDGMISPGIEWKPQIQKQIKHADIILLLISADFLASDECYENEMKTALERHNNNDAVVIPILLSWCQWQTAPFHKLQMLPSNSAPVKSNKWHNEDEAFNEVSDGIIKTVKNVKKRKEEVLERVEATLKKKKSEIDELDNHVIELEKSIDSLKTELFAYGDQKKYINNLLTQIDTTHNQLTFEQKQIASLRKEIENIGALNLKRENDIKGLNSKIKGNEILYKKKTEDAKIKAENTKKKQRNIFYMVLSFVFMLFIVAFFNHSSIIGINAKRKTLLDLEKRIHYKLQIDRSKKIKIINMRFGNTKNNVEYFFEENRSKFRSSNLERLKIDIKYKSFLRNQSTDSLYIKIYNKQGDLIKEKLSTDKFTAKIHFLICGDYCEKDSRIYEFKPLNIFESGKYVVELWYQGNLEVKKQFKILKK